MVALRVRLRASPSAQDDTRGIVWQRKLKFTLVFRRFLGLEFALEFRRNFFSFKLIKKPSSVGEGGPRQWWMRSPRDRLTLCRHLIRQPSAATFSHWRRLSFFSALYVNKHCGGNHCIMVAPAVEWHKSAPLCHPERRAKPGVEPVRATVGRDLQSSSAQTPAPYPRNGKPIRQHLTLPLVSSLLKRVRGKLFSRKVSPGFPSHSLSLA